MTLALAAVTGVFLGLSLVAAPVTVAVIWSVSFLAAAGLAAYRRSHA